MDKKHFPEGDLAGDATGNKDAGDVSGNNSGASSMMMKSEDEILEAKSQLPKDFPDF